MLIPFALTQSKPGVEPGRYRAVMQQWQLESGVCPSGLSPERKELRAPQTPRVPAVSYKTNGNISKSPTTNSRALYFGRRVFKCINNYVRSIMQCYVAVF